MRIGATMLIVTSKHTSADLREWAECESADVVHGQRESIRSKAEAARQTASAFVASHPRCYCGVSFGKDSTVLFDICVPLGIQFVWVRVEPIFNPDCLLVRDALLAKYPDVRYDEIVVNCRYDGAAWRASGTLESGFREAVKRYGERYILGLRAEESGVRTIRFWKHGLTSKRACAPLGWWSVADVFGYLAVNQLPVHPVYGMLGGGRWQREHLRVSSLGGQRGAGMGRDEHEFQYYGDVLAKLHHQR